MPVEVRYLFDLCNRARPRLAGVVQGVGQDRGVVEWQSDHGDVLDRMSFDQIRDLGVSVSVRVYGVKLAWRDQAVVVTPWPLPESRSPRQGDQDAHSGDAVVQGGAVVADASGGSWASSAMRADYVPPELEKRPEYSPHGTH
jgi:hypothetical protein